MTCNLSAPALAERRNGTTAQGLCEVAQLLEGPQHMDALWPQLAARIATMLDAETCWIVFAGAGAGGDTDDDRTVRAYKSDGTTQVQAAANSASAHPMLARASAMLVLHAARAGEHDTAAENAGCEMGENAILIPIRVEDMVLGVLHVQGARTARAFGELHVETGRIVAFLIGKALHLDRLQKVANSRFAQLALVRHAEAGTNGGTGAGTVTLRQALRQPKATAALMAKVFYQEMAKAGFTPPEIITAASAIISELTNALKTRRDKRGKSGCKEGRDNG